MLERIAEQAPIDVDPSSAAVVAASLLAWVAVVHLVMAAGARSGELVWSGAHVSRLPAEQRWWSVFYGLVLIGSGYVLLEMTHAVGTALIPSRWVEPAGFVVMALLGVATILELARGSRWERMLFLPITLLGAGLAAWLTFG